MTDPRIEAAAIALYVAVQPKYRTPEGWDGIAGLWKREYRTHATAALAAADKAATITGVEGLDALPTGAYVKGHDGFRHVKINRLEWLLCVDNTVQPHPPGGIELPAQLLSRGTE